jgi:hypothetical protein
MVFTDQLDSADKACPWSARLQWKYWRLILPLVAMLLAACSTTRHIPPPAMTVLTSAHTVDRCASFFPRGRWQLTHAINFRLADGTSGNAVGVLIINGNELSCALMSTEGLTLFAARSQSDGTLQVLRALPPFDNQGFAAGLIADVRAMFLPPPGAGSVGRLADGRLQCRYATGREVTDVLPEMDGCFRLSTYEPMGPSGETPVRTRTVEAHACKKLKNTLLARELDLTGHGLVGYTLNMRLLSAEPLPAIIP